MKNVVERAVILCEDRHISIHHLPLELQKTKKTYHADPEKIMTLKELEKKQIITTLDHTGNNKAAAARLLGINISTLARKMKKYEVQ